MAGDGDGTQFTLAGTESPWVRAALDLLDELCLTVAPVLVGGHLHLRYVRVADGDEPR